MTKNTYPDYLDPKTTTAVNGIFIFIVFFSHIQGYREMPAWIHAITSAFGQLMVAMFLFYSGYGVGSSIQKKGTRYIEQMPKRRVLKVLSRFIPAVLFFAIVDWLCGISFSFGRFCLSLIAWDNIGNSNWYVFVILCLYGITYVSYRLFGMGEEKDFKTKSVIAVAFGGLILALILFLSFFKDPYWYNTIPAYPMGMWLSYHKKFCDRVRSIPVTVSIAILSLAIVYALYSPGRLHISVYYVRVLFFCVLIVSLTKLIPVAELPVVGHGFHWLGEHLFEIYILMRIPMIVCQTLIQTKKLPILQNRAVFTGICLIVTLALAILFSRIQTVLSAGKSSQTQS